MAIRLYHGATLVTAQGAQRGDLYINTATGRISHPLPPDERINAEGLFIYAGLINAHDHLEFNHYPRTRTQPRYVNASQWAAEMTPLHTQEPFLSLRQWPIEKRCWVGGLKNLISGVTTVAHHNPLHHVLRDPVGAQYIAPLPITSFPLHVYQPYGWVHSLYLSPLWRTLAAYHRTRRGKFMLHLAEGTDEAANDELMTLNRWGLLTSKTVLIHGVGLRDRNLDLAVQKSGGLVWCPSSNDFLLGQTAQVAEWYRAGKLALGSDSLLTADGTLFDELRAAYGTGQLSAAELFHCVTDGTARLLGLTDRGDVREGFQADLLALRAHLHDDPYRALIEATPSNLAWVMRAGQVVWEQSSTGNARWQGVPFALAEPVATTLAALGLQKMVQLGFELV